MMGPSRKQKLKRRRRKRTSIAVCLLIVFTLMVAGGSCFFYHLEKVSAEFGKEDIGSENSQVQTNAKEEVNPIVEKSETEQQQIDDYLKKINFNGSIYIENRGKYLINKGFGYADIAANRKNNADSLFYIGSMQKAMIATAVLQLQEKGLLNIQDPIAKYLPEFPNGHRIKIVNFLSHTSGLRGRPKKNDYITPLRVIRSIEKAGIKQQPGKWDYHDENYSVAAYLVQLVSGMSMQEYVKKNIFMKAGMATAGFDDTFMKKPERTKSYQLSEDGTLKRLPFTQDISQFYGAGDMYMSTKDAVLFDNALANGKLLKEKEYKRMLKKGPGKYGFGFYDFNTHYIARGVLYGYETANAFTKDRKHTVILFTNARTEQYNLYQVTNNILKIMSKN